MPKQTVSASMSEDLVSRLEEKAAASGLSKSALVVMAVERMLAGSRPGGADLSEFPATGLVVAAEPPRAADPPPTPAGAVPKGTSSGKQYCIHPVSRRSGTVCMACGARSVR